jgi:Rha family phage regulatory protein
MDSGPHSVFFDAFRLLSTILPKWIARKPSTGAFLVKTVSVEKCEESGRIRDCILFRRMARRSNQKVYTKDGKLWCSSLDVAKHFGKEHFNILISIREIIDASQVKDRLNFKEISVPDTYGRPQPAYELTRSGFSILVMGFTGKEALAWKWKYIAAFDVGAPVGNSTDAPGGRSAQNSAEVLRSRHLVHS